MVWGYALAWFLVTDPVKLLAYRILDPAKAGHRLEAKDRFQPQAKSDAKPDIEPQPEAKAKPQARGRVHAEA